MFDAVPWPVYLLFLAAVLLPLGFKLRQQLKADRNLQRAGLAHIHRMAWPEFVRPGNAFQRPGLSGGAGIRED
jgi:hypothetical protein